MVTNKIERKQTAIYLSAYERTKLHAACLKTYDGNGRVSVSGFIVKAALDKADAILEGSEQEDTDEQKTGTSQA